MSPGEIKRLYFIIRVFLSYGLDELIPKIKLTLPLRIGRLGFFGSKINTKIKILVSAYV